MIRHNESDPCDSRSVVTFAAREPSPYVNRLELMWANMRGPILEMFPAAPGLAKNAAAYLQNVDDLYVADACNSLSIEGYRVSEALIDGVRSDAWNPEANAEDRADRNAMAARGYWQAFQCVKESLSSIRCRRPRL